MPPDNNLICPCMEDHENKKTKDGLHSKIPETGVIQQFANIFEAMFLAVQIHHLNTAIETQEKRLAII